MLIEVEIYYVRPSDELAVRERIDLNTKNVCALFDDELNKDFCYVVMRNNIEYNVTMTRQALKKLIKRKELTYLLQ